MWPPASSQGHSSTFVSFPPGAMPSRAASHAARVFLWPMKSPLFPRLSHARGLRASDISPSAALGGAEHAGCPSVFVWSFVPSITAVTVRQGEQGAESTARHRPTATARDLLWGMPSGEPEEEQLQRSCFSRLRAGNPSPSIPGAKALPAVGTCTSHPGTLAHVANPSLFGSVGTSPETRTERVRLVFKTALRLQ